MANKFQKSVLERLEQEAARQKQPTQPKEEQPKNQGTNQKVLHQEPMPLEQPAPEPVAPPQPELTFPPSSLTPEPSQPVPTAFQPADIGDYLRRDTQRTAKNKTFYLDADVIESVKATARAQEVTDSKLVNDILRRVLGL